MDKCYDMCAKRHGMYTADTEVSNPQFRSCVKRNCEG